MSEEGLAIVGNEMGFLWEENQCNIWANTNLSNNNSMENSSPSGGAPGTSGTAEAEEEEEKSEGKKIKISNGGWAKANKGKEGGSTQGNNNSKKRRSRGGVCKNNINGKPSASTATTTVTRGDILDDHDHDNQIMKEGNKVGGGGGESDHEIHIWTERERRKKMRNMFANLHALLPQLPPKADKSTIVDEAVNYIRTLQQTLQKLQKQKLEKLQGATTSTVTTSSFNCQPSIIAQQKVTYNDTREAFLANQGSCNDLVTMGNNIINPSNSLSSVVSQYSPVMFQTWTSSNVVLNICGDQAHISICSPKKPGLFSSICYVLEKHKITPVSAQISSDGNRSMYMIHARRASIRSSDQFLETYNPVEEVFKQAVGEIMLWVSS